MVVCFARDTFPFVKSLSHWLQNYLYTSKCVIVFGLMSAGDLASEKATSRGRLLLDQPKGLWNILLHLDPWSI